MSEEPVDGKARGLWGASSWVLAVAAVAGVGAGVGSSVAAGRSAAPAKPRAQQSQVPATPRPSEARPPEPVVAKAPPPAETTAAADASAQTEVAAGVAPPVPADVEQPQVPVDAAALERALDQVFPKQKATRAFAKETYATLGAGRFYRGGQTTALGAALVERVKALADYGIDAAPYQLEALESAIGAGASDPLTTDVRLFKTFFDLVMDFRFLHKAGPFRIYDRDDIFERERKELKDFVAAMLAAPDSASAMALLDTPHPQYRRMLEVLAEYRRMAAQDCPKLAAGWRFRAGSRGEEVKKLQQRLACEGYYGGEIDGRFEGPTVEAVKAYQLHHDLPTEGNVLEDTMKSLNVPLERRVKQIELALQRMREARVDRMGDFFIRVNLPSFMLKVYEKGQVIREHRVIVGTNKLDDDKVQLVQGHINRTKIFGTRLYEVIVNPTWILPKRVEEGELATSLDKDADYLDKSNIKKVKLGSGTEVFVQGAGKGNVLGKVKFLLEESNAIYLHDTDKRHLFNKQRRDFSHGCMRVDQAIEFGKWLLAHDGFSQEQIDKAFSLASLQTPFDLKTPVNLVTEYITVDLTADGKPIFYDDIYGYDEAYWSADLPPSEKTRWGSKLLRPRWVPVMEEATVEEWRKAGKPAPRNLGPDGKPKPESKVKDAAVDEGP